MTTTETNAELIARLREDAEPINYCGVLELCDRLEAADMRVVVLEAVVAAQIENTDAFIEVMMTSIREENSR